MFKNLGSEFSLTAVCHCGQEAYSLATGLNAAVLVTLLERRLLCLGIQKMQVWLERYLFKQKVTFSTSMKCLRFKGDQKWYQSIGVPFSYQRFIVDIYFIRPPS
jgi:hypothetical protein